MFLNNYINVYESIFYFTSLFLYIVFGTIVSLVILLTFTGKTRFSGRSLTLLDPSYAKK